MVVNEKKMKAVVALPAPKRYSHFIKIAADQRLVWGLFNDGWALFEADGGEKAFPLWPAQEYARLCAVKEWVRCLPKEIDLDTLLGNLLPALIKSGTAVAVFPTADAKGVIPKLQMLEADLMNELSRLE